MTDLEQFLRQASRGLWGSERQTIRRELESHIRHRAQRYEIDGSSEADAIKLAIADLGEAREISSGMKGVYIMPTTIRFGVLTAALATFGFMGAQLSTAQVTGTTKFPAPACLESSQQTYKMGIDDLPCEQGNLSISLKSLREVLEPKGVAFENNNIKDAITMRFPEGNAANLYQSGEIRYLDPQGKTVSVPVLKDYIFASTFFDQLRSTALPIKIEGWDNPRITVGKTSFTLGSSTQVVRGREIYPSLLYSQLSSFFLGAMEEPLFPDADESGNFNLTDLNITSPNQNFQHTIRTTLPPGSIAVVMSREAPITYTFDGKPQKSPKLRRAFIAPVAADGTIAYTSFSRTLAVVPTSKIIRGVPNGHATIAIARFTGEYTYKTNPLEPVNPTTLKIESR
jgi:hypothetical protein